MAEKSKYFSACEHMLFNGWQGVKIAFFKIKMIFIP